METIAIQTGKQITVELEKTKKRSKSITLCPYGKKGRISLHYGEFYLLAKAVNKPADILCDDESVETMVYSIIAILLLFGYILLKARLRVLLK